MQVCQYTSATNEGRNSTSGGTPNSALLASSGCWATAIISPKSVARANRYPIHTFGRRAINSRPEVLRAANGFPIGVATKFLVVGLRFSLKKRVSARFHGVKPDRRPDQFLRLQFLVDRVICIIPI